MSNTAEIYVVIMSLIIGASMIETKKQKNNKKFLLCILIIENKLKQS